MKIQYLAVIFIIIIMPIVIVFSEYINTQINIVKTEFTYDERLFDATHDAINAFQLNTINSPSYTAQARVKFANASVNIFNTSLVSNFQFDGNLARNMKDYVPAIVFTMYDGYYLSAPFVNTLTNVDLEDVDEEYVKKNSEGKNIDGKIINDLKPYVSYSCRYKKADGSDNREYIITYSMDNYIYVDVFDKGANKHFSKGGYLINGIVPEGTDGYKYENIVFRNNDKEILQEKLGPPNTATYYYTIINGTKYYYKGNNFNGNWNDCADTDYIFYINEQREEARQVMHKKNNEAIFEKYYNSIFNNNYAYLYYKEAYEFTKWVLESGNQVDIDGDGSNDQGLNLTSLKVEDIIGAEVTGNIVKKGGSDSDQYQFGTYEFNNLGNIFENDENIHIEYSNSNFNRHREEIIRAVITTNLSTAINGYKKYSNAQGAEFIMPKISETDWELLENNICVVAFLQGIKVKGSDKTYNSYCVIPNNSNKEYIDENDIYILTKDKTFTRSNDKILKTGDVILDKSEIGFEPGLFKVDFKVRQDKDKNNYNPVIFNNNLYLQSYTSLAGSSTIESIEKIDMYRYMKKSDISERLKEVYYKALARERYGSFKYTYTVE